MLSECWTDLRMSYLKTAGRTRGLAELYEAECGRQAAFVSNSCGSLQCLFSDFNSFTWTAGEGGRAPNNTKFDA